MATASTALSVLLSDRGSGLAEAQAEVRRAALQPEPDGAPESDEPVKRAQAALNAGLDAVAVVHDVLDEARHARLAEERRDGGDWTGPLQCRGTFLAAFCYRREPSTLLKDAPQCQGTSSTPTARLSGTREWEL